MQEDIALRATGVHKNFLLPHQQQTTLKTAFVNILRGRPSAESQKALRGVDFEVKKGEFFGIVGRNGSGKSTLLKILAGIYQPNKGGVSVEGKVVPFIELGVGFNPELTGRENVYLNGAILGFSKTEVDAMYDDIVGFSELKRFMDQKLKNYSSGMQVRLAFSIATRAKGDILIVDEVLAVGDADFQRKCFDYFKTLKQQKKTVIFVSHDMHAVREYCDRAILIENGVVIDSGDVKQVSDSYSQLFMGKTESAKRSRTERWGEGHVKYTKPVAEVTAQSVSLSTTLVVKKDVEDLVLGFTVLGADGVEVMGTNTRIKQQILKQARAGETYTVSWKFPNVLEDGRYTIALTAHGVSGQPVYDWWNNALGITVSKIERTGYKVNPDISVKVTKT